MISVTFTDIHGGEHELQIPTSLGGLRFTACVAFETYHEDLVRWVVESMKDDTFMENRNYYLYLITKALSEFFGYPLAKMMQFSAKDLLDAQGNLHPMVLNEHLDKLHENIDTDNVLKPSEEQYSQIEGNLLKLYEIVLNLINSYSYDSIDRPFRYKGRKFVIPRLLKTLFDGSEVYSKISVAQAVEILQVNKMLADVNVKDLDKNKNARFTAYLRTFSILAREIKDGEEETFPIDEIPFQEKVAERMVFFQDIDTKIAKDVCFFLASSMILSKNSKKTTIFSTLQKKLLTTK